MGREGGGEGRPRAHSLGFRSGPIPASTFALVYGSADYGFGPTKPNPLVQARMDRAMPLPETPGQASTVTAEAAARLKASGLAAVIPPSNLTATAPALATGAAAGAGSATGAANGGVPVSPVAAAPSSASTAPQGAQRAQSLPSDGNTPLQPLTAAAAASASAASAGASLSGAAQPRAKVRGVSGSPPTAGPPAMSNATKPVSTLPASVPAPVPGVAPAAAVAATGGAAGGKATLAGGPLAGNRLSELRGGGKRVTQSGPISSASAFYAAYLNPPQDSSTGLSTLTPSHSSLSAAPLPPPVHAFHLPTPSSLGVFPELKESSTRPNSADSEASEKALVPERPASVQGGGGRRVASSGPIGFHGLSSGGSDSAAAMWLKSLKEGHDAPTGAGVGQAGSGVHGGTGQAGAGLAGSRQGGTGQANGGGRVGNGRGAGLEVGVVHDSAGGRGRVEGGQPARGAKQQQTQVKQGVSGNSSSGSRTVLPPSSVTSTAAAAPFGVGGMTAGGMKKERMYKSGPIASHPFYANMGIGMGMAEGVGGGLAAVVGGAGAEKHRLPPPPIGR